MLASRGLSDAGEQEKKLQNLQQNLKVALVPKELLFFKFGFL